jgi:large-conductance mechanosensitive channel
MKDRIERIKEIKPLHHINREVGGFFDRLIAFLKEYSVIGVAIGVIVAQAAKDFVEAVVSGIFVPLLNLLIPGNELGQLTFSVRGVGFNLGRPFSTLVTLSIIVVFLYFIFKKIIRHELPRAEEIKREEATVKLEE